MGGKGSRNKKVPIARRQSHERIVAVGPDKSGHGEVGKKAIPIATGISGRPPARDNISCKKKASLYKQKGKQSHERIVAVGGGFEPPRRS